MRFNLFDHRLLLGFHQPSPPHQSKFIYFFNSLIRSAWLSNASLSLRFSASSRFISADFNGRLLRNDARTPTSNCRFHSPYVRIDVASGNNGNKGRRLGQASESATDGRV